MFLETVRSEGLAHLSYIFGDKGKAAVVDPRRDCEAYIDIAYREGRLRFASGRPCQDAEGTPRIR